MIRFCLPLFPGASHRAAGWVALLAIIGIIYGALVAMVQPNLKKLCSVLVRQPPGLRGARIFAFDNISMQGAVYQMLAHGISTGALFLLVGMLYDRSHTFEISEYGGLATPMPEAGAFFLFVALSSLGLPMLNGFVGEYLILLGTYQRHWQWASWAALGVILSACYLLWSYQRVFFGEITKEKNPHASRCVAPGKVDLGHHGRRDALDGNWFGVHHAPNCRRHSSRNRSGGTPAAVRSCRAH